MKARRQRAMRVWVGVLAVALAALAGCGRSPGTPGTTGTAAPTSTSTSPTTEPTPEPTTTTSEPTTPSSPRPTTSPTTRTTLSGMPVYFVGESQGYFKLFREFRTIRKIDGPISSSISAMMRLTPLDPEYFNPWRSASRVRVTEDAATLMVDVSADAFRNTTVGKELAPVAIQQLVYTALAASERAGSDAHSVVITVGGQRYDAWGLVHLEGPWQRAPRAEVQAQAWVVNPQEGDVVSAGLVNFTGYGTSFEGTFTWKVHGLDVRVEKRGTAMGGSMGTFGTVRFSAKLPPGKYVVELVTDDPSGGEGPGPAVDTKQFTVR